MFPTILQIGPLVISSLGLLTALGFFLASFIFWQKGREEHFEEDMLMDSFLLIILTALAMSRLVFVFFQLPEKISFFNLINDPGFDWQGAIIGGGLALLLYSRKLKWNFFKISDLVVFGAALLIASINLGQFFGQAFPAPIFSWHYLVKAGLFILLYFLLGFFDKNYRIYHWYQDKKGEAAPGFLSAVFLSATSLINLSSEIWKNWPKIFTFSQGLNLFLFFTGGFIFYFRSGFGLTFFSRWFTKKKGGEKKYRLKAGMEALK